MEHEHIRAAAFLSVGRACMFAALAIWAVAFGFIPWPVTALRLAAILSALTCAILAWKALTAPRRPYKRTEVWAMLQRKVTIPEERRQHLIADALVETFWRFATYAGAIALFLWIVALLFHYWKPGSL